MRHQMRRLAVFAGLLGVMACSADTGDDAAAENETSTVAPPSTDTTASVVGTTTTDSVPATPGATTDPITEALTLRPGDRITWAPSGPHRVQFGGTVTTGGGQVTLTSFADVSRILTDIQPALTPDANGVAIAPAGARVTARVRDDAAQAGLSSFLFTCGVPQHRNVMVTRDFTIAPASAEHPARELQIVSANNPFRWVLKSDQGDIDLTRP
jgi:hypothetical protein